MGGSVGISWKSTQHVRRAVCELGTVVVVSM